ncbi:MAG: hypothetical protein ACOY93_04365 [Bacillota bacterium]
MATTLPAGPQGSLLMGNLKRYRVEPDPLITLRSRHGMVMRIERRGGSR